MEKRLLDHSWPGNVRELRNVIDRAVLLCGADVTPAHLPPLGQLPTAAAPPGWPAQRRLQVFDGGKASAGWQEPTADPSRTGEPDRILRALDACGGNQTRAARLLGISRSTLIRRLQAYGFVRPRAARGSAGFG